MNDELIDKVAQRVVDTMGRTLPVRRVRKSQLLSALVGVVGFALFINGVEGLFSNLPDWVLVTTGFVLMALTGLLLQNLNR